jgi:hypothetical protein
LRKGNIVEKDKGIVPDYYSTEEDELDVIDVIEIFKLDFTLGNVLKYIVRYGKKNEGTQDLEKAMEYLQRRIDFDKK